VKNYGEVLVIKYAAPLAERFWGIYMQKTTPESKQSLEKPIDQRSPQDKSRVSNAKVTICIFWTNETRDSRSN
jgi:hypothetical protein